jgi:hypothetical protein
MNIVEKNGTGVVYVGESARNFFGDAFIKKKLFMNTTGMYTTPLEISYGTIRVEYDEKTAGENYMTPEEYSIIVWDIKGEYKIEITSYESDN